MVQFLDARACLVRYIITQPHKDLDIVKEITGLYIAFPYVHSKGLKIFLFEAQSHIEHK